MAVFVGDWEGMIIINGQLLIIISKFKTELKIIHFLFFVPSGDKSPVGVE